MFANAQTIVTEHIKDFPAADTEKYGIIAQTVDKFLVEQYDLNPNLFISVLLRQAAEAGVEPDRLVGKLNAPSLSNLPKLGSAPVRQD